jgi:hypothetical protein
MFYVSPTLTMLMLAVVPPVSLGAVRWFYMELKFGRQRFVGMVWSLPQETLQPNSRSHRRDDKGLSDDVFKALDVLILAIRLPRSRFQPYAQYKHTMLFLKKSLNSMTGSRRSSILVGKRRLQAVYSLGQQGGVEMLLSFVSWVMVRPLCILSAYTITNTV